MCIKMKPSLTVLLCSFLTLADPAFGQDAQYGGQGSFGFVLPHRAEMNAIVTGHSWNAGIHRGNWSDDGWRRPWSRFGPVWEGLEIGWLNGGSPNIGQVGSALWMIQIPFATNSRVQLGTGAGWAFSPYSIEDRPLSFALGSHLNAGLHLSVHRKLFTFHEQELSLSAGITHFSNGAIALPNLGINNLFVRCSVFPSAESSETQRKEPESSKQFEDVHWKAAFSIRSGVRDVNLPGGPLHPISTLIFHLERAKRNHWGMILASDITYNQSLRENADQALTVPDRLQLSSGIGAILHFGNVDLNMVEGWVWTNPDIALGRRHLTATLAYSVNPDIKIEMGLRSFRLRADYAFLGLSVGL